MGPMGQGLRLCLNLLLFLAGVVPPILTTLFTQLLFSLETPGEHL